MSIVCCMRGFRFQIASDHSTLRRKKDGPCVNDCRPLANMTVCVGRFVNLRVTLFRTHPSGACDYILLMKTKVRTNVKLKESHGGGKSGVAKTVNTIRIII